jgi:hypothetical protein
MRRAPRPSLISPKARGASLKPKRRRSNLHTRGTGHLDVIGRKQPKKPLKACHSGNVSGVGASSHPKRMQSDTGALLQKECIEEKWVRKAKVKLLPIPNWASQALHFPSTPPHPPLCLTPPLAHKGPRRRDLEPHPLHKKPLSAATQLTQWTEHFTQAPPILELLPPTLW